MGDRSRFAVTSERHEPHVLSLHGSISTSETAGLLRLVDRTLQATEVGLVLDLTDVDHVSPAMVAAVNEAAACAVAHGRQLTLRLPEDALPELATAPLSRGIVYERTRRLRVLPAPDRAAKTAAPGATARKDKAGHIVSYGEDRRCGVPGCGTNVSRYNPQDTCYRHTSGRS